MITHPSFSQLSILEQQFAIYIFRDWGDIKMSTKKSIHNPYDHHVASVPLKKILAIVQRFISENYS